MPSTALSSAAVPSASHEKHPKGLYVLFATEMWERFSFYSMLAMFTLYLRDDTGQGFGWSSDAATGLYANYLMFVSAADDQGRAKAAQNPNSGANSIRN